MYYAADGDRHYGEREAKCGGKESWKRRVAGFSGAGRKGLVRKWYLSKQLKGMREKVMSTSGKGAPGGGSSKCKGPGVEICPVCLGNNKGSGCLDQSE